MKLHYFIQQLQFHLDIIISFHLVKIRLGLIVFVDFRKPCNSCLSPFYCFSWNFFCYIFKFLQHFFCLDLNPNKVLTNFQICKTKEKKSHNNIFAYNKKNKKQIQFVFSTPRSFPWMVTKW